MKKVFFIGFNKTATVAFHNLFLDSGYASWHNFRRKGKSKNNLGKVMQYNLQNNLPILTGIDDAIAYSDLGGSYKDSIIEGCTLYKEMYKEYPDSYFILQTRPKNKWLQSRIKWRNLPQRIATTLNITVEETLERWSTEWDEHHNNVRTFFKNNPNFLEYNIETDDIDKLIRHVSKDFVLLKDHWKKRNITK